MMRNKQIASHQKKQKKPSTGASSELTLLEHVYELRARLFWVVCVFILASAIGFQFKDQLISLIMEPLHGQKLVYLTPAGGFSFIFALSLYFGALICIPFAIYHLYRFVQPVLGAASRRFTSTIILLSIILAATGALFGYFVTIPAAITFLATFAGDVVVPNLTAESYLSFVVTYIIGLAALFQLPLLINIFDRARPIPPKKLLTTQQYVVVGSAVISAIITPTPDAFNMAIVAVPIIVVYQFGVVAVLFRHRIRRPKRAVAPVQAVAPQPVSPVVSESRPAPQPAAIVSDVARVAVAPVRRATTQKLTPVVSRQMPMAPRKTIDGFRRPAPQIRTQPPGTVQPTVRRSLDGFTIAQTA